MLSQLPTPRLRLTGAHQVEVERSRDLLTANVT
jgi:hypothetical protein